jgi:hypothetical protein
MAITIQEVTTKKDLRRFARFPNELYRWNKYYVPQLVGADMDTLTREKNKAFEVCEGRYWLARNEKGTIVGRVAGIINHKYNDKTGIKYCRFGWIDFIESQEVVHALLSKVEEYAREKGMDIVEGPMGFLEFDVAGILVEGFDRLPTAYSKYNAPYYESLILNEGYTKVVDYVEYLVKIPKDLSRYEKFSKIVAERNNLREAPVKKRRDLLKYADGIFACLNRCYANIHGFSELSPAQCEDLKKQFLGQLVLDYVSVILDKNDKVVAFGICLPSLSLVLQKVKGHLFPFGFIEVLRALRHNDTVDALLIAIDDEYKDKGVNAMIASKIGAGFHKHGIKYLESTRELENNNSVQNMWSKLDHQLVKRARIYEKEV